MFYDYIIYDYQIKLIAKLIKLLKYTYRDQIYPLLILQFHLWSTTESHVVPETPNEISFDKSVKKLWQ